MRINGKLHRITNFNEFVASFAATGGKPTKGFANFGKARIHFATDFPLKKFADEASFIPPSSIKIDTDSTGQFSFSVPDAMKDFRGYLIAYEQVSTVQVPVPGVPSIAVFAAVYRSATFKISAVKDTLKNIFIQERTTDNNQGFSQAEVDALAKDLKKKNKLDRLAATVKDGRISCTVEARGAVGTFDIRVRASTSHDLDKFVELKAEEIDIDLPGPDAIVGICVSEDDIKKQLRSMIASRSSVLNDEIAKQIPDAIRDLTSVTVHRVRFPVTGKKTVVVPVVPDIEVPTRSIVPDVSVGVPRKLY